MARKRIQGIYKITNTTNGKIYIGSSSNIEKRWREHRNLLITSSHSNLHLQNSWNKYGEGSFVFEKIEDVNREEDLINCEQWFLDNVVRWGTDYNEAKDATAPMRGRKHSKKSRKKMSDVQSGENHPMWNKHHSEETKKKMSEARSGSKHPMWGRHHSEETRQKLGDAQRGEKSYMWGMKGQNHPRWNKKMPTSAREKISKANSGEGSHTSKLTNIKVLEIRYLYSTRKYTQKELAKQFNVTQSTISAIITRKTWKNI